MEIRKFFKKIYFIGDLRCASGKSSIIVGTKYIHPRFINTERPCNVQIHTRYKKLCLKSAFNLNI